MNMITRQYKSYFPAWMRIIASILVITFLWQDVIWAYPDINNSRRTSQKDTLQVETILSNPKNFHIATPSLIQQAIENSVASRNELTLDDIKETLKNCDKWKSEQFRNYDWQVYKSEQNANDTEIIITFKDYNNNPYSWLRYHHWSPDPTQQQTIEEQHLSQPLWKGDNVKTDTVNRYLRRQIKVWAQQNPDTGQSQPAPHGNAIDPRKLEQASMVGAGTALILALASFSTQKTLFSVGVSLLFLATVLILPMLTSLFIKKALLFKGKKYPIIRGLQGAEDIAFVIPQDSSAQGKLSYYSYDVEEKLKSKKEDIPQIKSALFIDETAMKHLHPFFQRIVFIHEVLIHKILRIDLEPVAVVFTFCLPALAVLDILLFGFGWFLTRPDRIFLAGLIVYNLLVIILSWVVAMSVGTTKTKAGHRRIDTERHRHLNNTEVDRIISHYAHKKTLTEEERMTYWRDWLEGGEAQEKIELIPVKDRPDDIIVVKASCASSVTEEEFVRILEKSEKRSFVLIISDNGLIEGSPGELNINKRKKRIDKIAKTAENALDAINRSQPFLISPMRRFIRKDMRSTIYNIGRLRDLTRLFRKRLDDIKEGSVEPEAVACEVHGEVEKLKALLAWLKKKRYRKLIFMGDYIGKEKNGLEAIDILMEHVTQKETPHLTLLMGASEHLFLRAMFGDQSACYGGPFTKTWSIKSQEGKAVMESLKEVGKKAMLMSYTSPQMTDQIRRIKEFEEALFHIAKRERRNIDSIRAEWYRFHPRLLDIAQFMVDNMYFVFHEDTHHNIYLSGGIPADFEQRGLRGIAALISMEEEFRENAKKSIHISKLMSKVWRVTHERESAYERTSQERVEDVIKVLSKQKGLNALFDREFIDNNTLDQMRASIDENTSGKELDVIFRNLSKILTETRESIPEEFKEIFESFLRTTYVARGLNISDVAKRQRRELNLGVNTIFSLSDFTRGIQKLGQVRLLDKNGNLLCVSVDALLRGEFEADTVLTGKTKDEITPGRSLESITKRKLWGLRIENVERVPGVEEVVSKCNYLASGLRDKWNKRLLANIKFVLTMPLVRRSLLTVILLILDASWIYFRLNSPEAFGISDLLYLGMRVSMVKSADERRPLDEEEQLGALVRRYPEEAIHGVCEQEYHDPAASALNDGKSASLTTSEAIKENAKEIMPLLVRYLMKWAKNVYKEEGSKTQEKDSVVMLLDVPPEYFVRIKQLIKESVIDPLRRISGNNDDIKRILVNLEFADSQKIEVIKERIRNNTLRSRNVIVVTNELNQDKFKEFISSFITVLDSSDLVRMDGPNQETYYPYFEATFFALVRALDDIVGENIKHDTLAWYKKIPNAEILTEAEIMDRCFEKNGMAKRQVIIKLVPQAKPFNPEELREIYRAIEELIRKA